MISMVAWAQIGLFLLVLVLCTRPLGLYMAQVLSADQSTFLDPILKPLEKVTYKILRIDPLQEQTWVQYLVSVMMFSLGALIFTMLILFLQPYLPFNPQNLPSPSWHLNLNTAVSYVTNTNWQSYSGETTLSYFSQMAALTVQSFVSPAVGIAVGATLVRSLARSKCETIGNFWTDLVRICYYLLLPLSIVLAIVFISEGIPQNLSAAVQAQTIDGLQQTIAQGPVASQEAIKLIGTNGGGFFNANSAHPYENPTPLCNLLQMLAILVIPAAQIYYLGVAIKHKKHAGSIYSAVAILFVVGAWLCIWSETNDALSLTNLGVYGGNMEGKEQRFGIAASAFFTSAATDTSCGAINSSFDSMTPLGGLIPLMNMLFSEAIFGGCGSGLYILLIYVFVAVFFAGLIIGRTPEYLGQKVEANEIKLTMIVLLIFGFTTLSLASMALVTQWGLSGIANSGPHGFTEALYAFVSTAANNGSAFSGLSTNTAFYNTALSVSMLVGRFGVLIPVLALAGSLIRKKKAHLTPTNLVVHGPVFTVFFMAILLLFGALTFLPALVIGPIFEYFAMHQGLLF